MDLNLIIRYLRIVSGSLLFFYVVTHLSNHSLGIISIDAMEYGRSFFLTFWRNYFVSIILYSALAIHLLLGIYALARRKNIKLTAIGSLKKLPKLVQNHLYEVIKKTSLNNGTNLTLALSYGAREEINQAIIQISEKVKNNLILTRNIDETIINEHLYTKNLPDVDLLIRTSGEVRISNFLLWQIAYAELYFTNELWPEFNEDSLDLALESFNKRERRFGKTS